MRRRLIYLVGFLVTTITAILVGQWLVGASTRPSTQTAADRSAAPSVEQSAATAPTTVQNCTDYPAGPDRAYCDRDMSTIVMRPTCDTLTNSEFLLECGWRETIIARAPDRCEELPGDRRDICLWDVSVVRHAYAGRPPRPDFSLCDRIKRTDIQELCRTRSYAMEKTQG